MRLNSTFEISGHSIRWIFSSLSSDSMYGSNCFAISKWTNKL